MIVPHDQTEQRAGAAVCVGGDPRRVALRAAPCRCRCRAGGDREVARHPRRDRSCRGGDAENVPTRPPQAGWHWDREPSPRVTKLDTMSGRCRAGTDAASVPVRTTLPIDRTAYSSQTTQSSAPMLPSLRLLPTRPNLPPGNWRSDPLLRARKTPVVRNRRLQVCQRLAAPKNGDLCEEAHIHG